MSTPPSYSIPHCRQWTELCSGHPLGFCPVCSSVPRPFKIPNQLRFSFEIVSLSNFITVFRMPQVMIIAKNFMDMVASLPTMKLDNLYNNTYICEAVLRSLPPLGKKYVLQLLYIDEPISARVFKEWLLPDGFSKHKVAIDRLIQLRVFIETTDRKNSTSYRLNPKFQGNLQKYLKHGIVPRESMSPSITLSLPNSEELDHYALDKWERFLLQLIKGQPERHTTLTASMMRVFQGGHLSQRENESPRLTPNGFQFLLMDTNAQLWYIIRDYISNSEDRGVDSADLISFLLELSFHVTGQAFSLNVLSEVQNSILNDLAELGVVKLQKGSRGERWFIPTKLAKTLSVSLTDSASRKEGFVSVETNFRMYAYSTSQLHCELLRLFSRVEYQLTNLTVAAITKESLYNAFENGITADQIICFLQQNAHPLVADKTPCVPENVTDQIRLWESDLNRVQYFPSHLYDDFTSKDVFTAACDKAREFGGLLWEDSQKMKLVVKSEIHVQMREVIRSQR